jgi:hypothetical protein
MKLTPKPVELTEVILVRPGYGTIARGPVMGAKGNKAIGVLLGPVEALAGDKIAIIAVGRQSQVWELEAGFLLVGRKIRGGTWANGAKLDMRLDTFEQWSTLRAAKMFSDRRTEYVRAFNDPDVVVVLG